MAKKRHSKRESHSTRGSKAGYYIFRAWKLDPKTGEKMWAKDHGLKAWKIWVPFDGKPTRANQ
jgi:hypothetical protein